MHVLDLLDIGPIQNALRDMSKMSIFTFDYSVQHVIINGSNIKVFFFFLLCIAKGKGGSKNGGSPGYEPRVSRTTIFFTSPCWIFLDFGRLRLKITNLVLSTYNFSKDYVQVSNLKLHIITATYFSFQFFH